MDIRAMLDKEFRLHNSLWVKRTIRGSVTNEMAEDAVQIAMERAIKRQDTYDSSREFKDWLSTILRNALRDVIAEERRGGMKVEYQEELDGREYFIEEDSELMATVRKEVDKLPDSRKLICHLYFVQGLNPREISEVVDNTNKSIRNIILRFKKKFRRDYEGQFCGEARSQIQQMCCA